MVKEGQRHIVRDIFVILLCAAVLGIAVSVIADKASRSFDPFFPAPIAQTVDKLFYTKDASNRSDAAPTSVGVEVPAPAAVPPLAPAPDPFLEVTVAAESAEANESLVLDELDSVLANTANANRTVILTALNKAWAEPNSMIDLFLESFRIGEGTQELLNNLLIICLDAKAYNRCQEIHPHCYTLVTRGIDFSAEKVFMSHDYLMMMWRRLGFLGEILKRGYSFVFSDSDIMWLRNPFKIFAEEADIQIASDRFNGVPYDLRNMPNGGYKFVRSNNKTIAFYKFWYMSRRLFPGQNEQDVLNILKFRGSFKKMVSFRFLDTKHFGGFCERSDSLDDVYTMHANCCKGLQAKLLDLRQTLDDWQNYRNPPPNSTRDFSVWRPPYACQHSWDR